VYPIVVVLLDGLGDRAHEALGGRTANEAAETPNLDAFAARGSCGLLYAVGPGRAPSSEVAHWSMLGYRPDEFPGRAVFEAVGRGQDVSPENVFAYAALRPAERRADGWWLTGRPDPQRDADEVARLVMRCERIEVDGLVFSLEPTWRGEAVLRISGDADERVTDTDAFFRAWYPLLRPRPLVPDAERTARACEAWTREVMRRLEGERFNVITLKWFGRPRRVPSFRERHGITGGFAAGSAFLRGLGRSLGLEPIGRENLDLGLVRRRLDGGDTFVYVHDKRADEAGHTKDPRVKQMAVEELDAELAGLADLVGRAIVCVTGDHATPPAPDVIHSGDPVPLLVAGPGVRADAVRRFGELDCAAGMLGRVRGPELMPLLLNAADRPLFLGSRPTPVDGADGYPDRDLLEPLI
jgi:2,3-bisphosphoglycerate-independent phosphoglycerate mutase